MPQASGWVDPRRVLTHRGVKVYCTYRRNDGDDCENQWRFTLHKLCDLENCHCDDNPDVAEDTEGCVMVFDVRDVKLPGFQLEQGLPANERIKQAIDAGHLGLAGAKHLIDKKKETKK